MNRTTHWDQVYTARDAQQLSWYQPRPATSLRLIAELGIQPSDALIDVGGGMSNLVDHLLDQGFNALTLLDISPQAVAAVQARLGARAERVRWLVGDITRVELEGPFRLWHDRAVFHFLTDPADREAYRKALHRALPGGAYLIVATFAAEGPERCSNLPVCRYSPEQLAAELGPDLEPLRALRDIHVTPGLGQQPFTYGVFRRRS